MKKNYSLVLTNNFKNFKKKSNLLFIRPFNEKKINNFSKLVFFPKESKKKIFDKYNYCEKIYKSIFIDLKNELNKIHSKNNYSSRFWEIIIGTWLKEFICVSYKNYNQIKYIKENYNIKEIYLLDYKKFNFIVNDTESFTWATCNSTWIYSFLSKILEYQEYNCKKIISEPKKIFSYNKKKQKKLSIKNFLFSLFKISSIINNLLKIKNHVLITKTGLPFKFEKLLEIKFFQMPTYYEEYKIKYKTINNSIRDKIILNSKINNDPFENFIRKNLNFFLPRYVVENFLDIEKISNNVNFPKNPKFIFTSLSYAHDEVFKSYVAQKANNKIPYFVGQHGNNFFSIISRNYNCEFNYSDKYLSWGFKNRKNIERMFNFKTLNKKHKFSKNGKLVIIFDYFNHSTMDLSDLEQIKEKHLQETIILINSLDNKIKKNTILRLNRTFYYNFFGKKYFDNFKSLNIEIDNGDKDFSKLIKNSRLCLYNYDSTGLLENFLLNYPTIFFCENTYLNTVDYDFEKKYQLLIDNNIMFTNTFNILTHINKNWDNIENWWFSQKQQNIIKKFNSHYNLNANKHNFKKLENFLKQSCL